MSSPQLDEAALELDQAVRSVRRDSEAAERLSALLGAFLECWRREVGGDPLRWRERALALWEEAQADASSSGPREATFKCAELALERYRTATNARFSLYE